MAFPCQFAAALCQQLLHSQLGCGVVGQAGTAVHLVDAFQSDVVCNTVFLAHTRLGLHQQHVGIAVNGEVTVGVVGYAVFKLEFEETGTLARIGACRILNGLDLGGYDNIHLGVAMFVLHHFACPGRASVNDGFPVGLGVVHGTYEPLVAADILVGIEIIERLQGAGTVPAVGGKAEHVAHSVVLGNQVEHIAVGIDRVEHNGENNLLVAGVVGLEGVKVVFVEVISVAAFDNLVAILFGFCPAGGAGINLGVEIELGKYHIGHGAGHGAVAHGVVHKLCILEQFLLDPLEHFLAGVLLDLALTVVDMHVAIYVHGQQVVECTENLGLGKASLGCVAPGGFVFACNGMDVIYHGVALCYATVCKTPAIVHVAGVAEPGVGVHGDGDAAVVPVGTAGGHHHFVGSVFLQAPEALTVNVSVFAGQLRIGVGDQRRELLGSLEVIFLENVGIYFRAEVHAGRKCKRCYN